MKQLEELTTNANWICHFQKILESRNNNKEFEAVIKCLFKEGFKTIRASHHIDNPASGRVMEKSGMKFLQKALRDCTDLDQLAELYYTPFAL